MSILTAKPIQNASDYAVEDLFSLSIFHKLQNTEIIMRLFIPTVNTIDIPWTYPTLKRHLPTVLRSTCFNEEKLPFSIEVRRTEIGHLFEHILLEYLCQQKLLKGFNKAIFSGTTQWNWKRDPRGMFHIAINMDYSDTDIFPNALQSSISLLRSILKNEPLESFSYSTIVQVKKQSLSSLLSSE